MRVFIITGTHEQPFDRLVAAADDLAAAGHDVFVQYGYASAPPARAEGSMWLTRSEVERRCAAADVIVTHGGPGSIWDAFSAGKVPIVTPRSARHGEHVDDHQQRFAAHLARHRRVLTAAPEELAGLIAEYPERSSQCAIPADVGARNRRELGAQIDRWLADRTRRTPVRRGAR